MLEEVALSRAVNARSEAWCSERMITMSSGQPSLGSQSAGRLLLARLCCLAHLQTVDFEVAVQFCNSFEADSPNCLSLSLLEGLRMLNCVERWPLKSIVKPAVASNNSNTKHHVSLEAAVVLVRLRSDVAAVENASDCRDLSEKACTGCVERFGVSLVISLSKAPHAGSAQLSLRRVLLEIAGDLMITATVGTAETSNTPQSYVKAASQVPVHTVWATRRVSIS